MADPVVRYEAHEKVSVITLNRPEKLNAISAELQGQLLAAFTRADEDAETSVVLLQAEGHLLCRLRHLGEGAGDGRLAQ